MNRPLTPQWPPIFIIGEPRAGTRAYLKIVDGLEIPKKESFEVWTLMYLKLLIVGCLPMNYKAVFGARHSVDQMGKEGSFVPKAVNSEWIFEPGDFAQHACANERIRYLIVCRCGA
jgi:hypothetical protein